MKNSTKVKIVLLVFFVIFFGFLTWYFYEPNTNINIQDTNKNNSDVNLFPFENGFEYVDDTEKNDNSQQYTYKKYVKPKISRLRQITKIPTAGIVFDPLTKEEIHLINVKKGLFDTENAWTFDDHISEIRFVSQKKGNIYSTFTNSKRIKRVSNTTILKVYEAEFWDKDNLIVRYLDEDRKIKTYSIKLRKKTDAEFETEKNKLEKGEKINKNLLNFSGIFLPTGITDFTLLPNTHKLFYLIESDDNENILGIKSESFGEDRIQIFKSPLKEWNIKWKNPKHILINSKAAKDSYTLFFDLNTKSAKLDKVGRALLAGNGLPNYNFTKILFSKKNERGHFGIYVYDLKKKELEDLDLVTIVEKCVWSKNNIDVYCAEPVDGIKKDEPDNWYKGYTNFSDSIFKIDTNTKKQEMILDAYLYQKNLDVVKIKLDYFENYLYFIDSKTNFAWSFDIFDKDN